MMSTEEISDLVTNILQRKYPASQHELCLLFRHYVSPDVPMIVLMYLPEHAIRQCVSVMMYRHLRSTHAYLNKLRIEIGKVTGASPRAIYDWVTEKKQGE